MTYHHIVEIGAGDRASSQALNMWREAHRITLYEPNVILWRDLYKASDVLPDNRIRIYNAAVGCVSGYTDMFHLGYASFLVHTPSFLALSVEPEGLEMWKPLLKEVTILNVSNVDQHADIDYLILTANGCELEILSGMKSRPKVIRTKLYCHNAAHIHEANRTTSWFAANRYDIYTLETNQHRTYYHLEARLR